MLSGSPDTMLWTLKSATRTTNMNIHVFRPFKTGFRCTCGAAQKQLGWDQCECPDAWRRPEYSVKFRYLGEQVLRTTGLTSKREAESRGRAIAEEFKAGNGDAMMQALNMVARRRVFCSIAEVIAAYESKEHVLIKDAKQLRRNALSLLRVVAFARGMWKKNPAGPERVNGVPIGGDIAAVDAIGALPTSVLTDALVMDYLRAAAGGVADFSRPAEGNKTINSTLRQARAVFSKRTVALKFRDLALPNLDGFMKHPGLPESAVVPEPVKAGQFDAMLAAVAALPEGDVRRTVNLILRQTGMRSGSLVALHRDWLEKFEDGYTLHIRTVKGGTAEYSLPVTEELAALVLASDGYTLPGDERERRRAVESHTAWVKTVIGESTTGSEQGNHRLRDTVASIAFSWLGRDAAVEMLGNGREVNKRHYAKLRINVSEAMKHELRAAKRLRPENVVAMPAAKVA